MKTKCCACGKEFALLDAPFYIRQGSHPLCVDCYKRVLPSGSLQAMLISKNVNPRAFAEEYISAHEAIDQSGFAENIITGLQQDLDQVVEDYYNRHPGFKEAVENSPAFTGEAERICYCPGCGAECRTGAKFCENCGHSLDVNLCRSSSSDSISSAAGSPKESSAGTPAANESQAGSILSILGLIAVIISFFLPLANFRYYSAISITTMGFIQRAGSTSLCWVFGGLLIVLIGMGTRGRPLTIFGAILTGSYILFAAYYADSRHAGILFSLDTGFYTYLVGCLLILAGLMMPADQRNNVRSQK